MLDIATITDGAHDKTTVSISLDEIVVKIEDQTLLPYLAEDYDSMSYAHARGVYTIEQALELYAALGRAIHAAQGNQAAANDQEV